MSDWFAPTVGQDNFPNPNKQGRRAGQNVRAVGPAGETGQLDIPLEAAESAEGERLRKEREQTVCQRICDLADAGEKYAAGRYACIRDMRRMYYDQHDFSKKAAWQSRVWDPAVFETVEKAVALYSGGLVPSEEWFESKDSWRGDEARTLVVDKLMGSVLEQADFYSSLGTMLQEGFLGGSIPTVLGVDSTGDVPQVSMRFWDPLDVSLDWSGRGRFLVLKSEVDGYVLRQWAEQGLYDGDRVKQALETGRPDSSGGVWQQQMPTYLLRTWYGDLVDAEGKLLLANGHAVVVNDKVLLRPLVPNPWNWGRAPVVIGNPIRKGLRVWAAGLIEHLAGVARGSTEMLNAMMDAATFAAVQGSQVDPSRVSPADLSRGMRPGALFRVRDLGTQGDALKPLVAGRFPAELIQVLALLQRIRGEASGVTEMTSGSPPIAPTGRRTAREVQMMMQQASSLILSMAHELQISWLQPVLEGMLSIYAQVVAKSFRALRDPTLMQALGPQAILLLGALDDESRAEILTRGMRFKAHGISAFMHDKQDLEKLLSTAAVIRKDPETARMMKMRAWMEKALHLNRLDPGELLYTEEEMQQRAAQMPPQGGGGMPGPGGAGSPLAPRRPQVWRPAQGLGLAAGGGMGAIA